MVLNVSFMFVNNVFYTGLYFIKSRIDERLFIPLNKQFNNERKGIF